MLTWREKFYPVIARLLSGPAADPQTRRRVTRQYFRRHYRQLSERSRAYRVWLDEIRVYEGKRRRRRVGKLPPSPPRNGYVDAANQARFEGM